MAASNRNPFKYFFMKYLFICLNIKKCLNCFAFIFFCLQLSAQVKDSFYTKKMANPATSIITLKEGYKIFSQKFGTGKIKLLLLHGGPTNSHEGFEIFLTQLPLDKYTIIFYDQLGSYYSDQPTDTTLWNIPRFVDEVEQVRQFYKLENFYLLGHSWGGLLAMEYALKYGTNLKGLIVSNKSYSYEKLRKTRQALNIKIAEELKCSANTIEAIKNGTRISDTLEAKKISDTFNRQHLRRLDVYPDALTRLSLHNRVARNTVKYFHDMNDWNILNRLHFIKQPTLLIGSKNDFVKTEDLEEMKKQIPNARLYVCPNGSHFDFWDDTENYFKALNEFVNRVEINIDY
jgi:proline iminopeptidase